jgi:hypothetical protein
VALIRTDVSEDRRSSATRVAVYTRAYHSLCACLYPYTLKMEAIRSFETSVLIRATRRHLPEDDNHQR